MDKKELIKSLKDDLLEHERSMTFDYRKSEVSDEERDEYVDRCERINKCKTMRDIASYCQDAGWDVDAFIGFLFEKVWDEEWDIWSAGWDT